MAIMFPIAMPTAYAVAPGSNEIMVLTISAILAGAVYGDHCAYISDTTILRCSRSTGGPAVAIACHARAASAPQPASCMSRACHDVCTALPARHRMRAAAHVIPPTADPHPPAPSPTCSAMSSKCDLRHHVRTQFPYATFAMIIAALIGYLPAGFGTVSGTFPYW
jgi:hypothetical protein